jgi:hypothetical protein
VRAIDLLFAIFDFSGRGAVAWPRWRSAACGGAAGRVAAYGRALPASRPGLRRYIDAPAASKRSMPPESRACRSLR